MINKEEFLKTCNLTEDDLTAARISWEELTEIYEDYMSKTKLFRHLGKEFVDEYIYDIERAGIHSYRYRTKAPGHLLEKIIRKKKEQPEKFAQLGADIAKLWSKYGTSHYLPGIRNTLILALVATAIGCLIGFVCGILNTIPHSKNDPPVKRFFLALIRAVVRIYVEIFRGTPMVLQAVFLYYGLPYFTDNAVRFDSIWMAAILVVSLTSVFLLTSVMAAQRVNRQAGEGDEQLRLEQDVVERRSDGKQSTVQIGGGSYPVIRYGEGEALQGYVLQSEEGAG